ncbi:MAG TPA: Zn-ribbon domain-containing OB-fold protein [Sneathiellales bacterium]|jgi:hypothetical protein|nr:Zn-ribbon domain-containing OB-fold protein [Sneathiellales bacterium]
MIENQEDRLLPEPDQISQPFWDGLHQHRLLLQTCSDCGAVRHYPRPVCDQCYSMDYSWTEASGRGTVHSWTVSHHAFHFSFKKDLPMVLALIDLEEGVRLNCRLTGIEPENLRAGLQVQVKFDDVTDAVTLPIIAPLTK